MCHFKYQMNEWYLYTQSPMNWTPEDLVKCSSIVSPPIKTSSLYAVYHHGVIIPRSVTQTAPHYARYLCLLQSPRVRWVMGGWTRPRVEMPVVTATVVI